MHRRSGKWFGCFALAATVATLMSSEASAEPTAQRPVWPTSATTFTSTAAGSAIASKPMRLASVAILAAGAATVGTGVFFAYRAHEKAEDASAHCQDQMVCDAHGHGLRENATQWTNAATATLAMGGGLMLVGGLLFAITHFRGDSSKLEPPRLGRIRVEPGLGQVNLRAIF